MKTEIINYFGYALIVLGPLSMVTMMFSDKDVNMKARIAVGIGGFLLGIFLIS